MARAEGNAYYAEELLAALRSPAIPAERRALPAGLAALLLSRVEQLSDAAQRVLRAAAVAGRRADDELVRAASGLAGRRIRGRGPGGGHPPAARARRHGRLRLPARAAARGRLHRPAARGADQAARPMSTLLADEQRLAVPGTAAELAHHCLASHDIPGAFAASVRAGEEAERLGAPAEAHRHYDQALALWERVGEPEKPAGMARGKLACCPRTAPRPAATSSAPCTCCAGSGRRSPPRPNAGHRPGRRLASRIGERLAYYLMLRTTRRPSPRPRVARATVHATPADPPTWQYARAMATYANTLLHRGRRGRGQGTGRSGRGSRPGPPDAPGWRPTPWSPWAC